MIDLYRRVLNFTHDGVYRYSFEDGRVLMANQGLVEILELDCTPEEVEGRYLRDLLIYTEREGTVRRALEEEGEIHGYEYHFRTLEGREKWVIHDSFILRDPDTGEKVVEAIVKDITERKEAERALWEEKERLEVTLQSIGDGVIATDTEGRVVLLNRAAEALTGWPEQKAIGRPLAEVFEIIGQQDRRPCTNPVETVLSTGETIGLANDTILIARDGTERYIADRAAPIRGHEGQTIGVVLGFRDVTEKKEAERELRRHREHLEQLVEERTARLREEIQQHRQMEEKLQTALEREKKARRRAEEAELAFARSEARYRAIGEAIPFGVWMCDAEGRLEYLSDSFLDLVDMSMEEVKQAGWMEQLPPVQMETTRQERPEAVENGEPWDRELKIKGADEDWYTILSRGVPVRDEEGNILNWVGINLDITERRREQDELRAAKEELERSNKELEEFAYVASHDLQEPLRKITAFGERLADRCGEELDERARDYLDRMQNAASRMRGLINDLLTFSRVTTRAQPFTPVDLNEVVEEVISDLEIRIQELHGEVEVGDLPTIDAEPTQMRQLFQNLIGNGLKFHREDVPPVVEVEGELTQDETGEEVCRLRVKDNGIGFDEKYLDRIFTIFQRLHARGEYAGTGVGLALCSKIVRRHGGDITAESEPGQGATFIVTLPVEHETEEGGAAEAVNEGATVSAE